MIGNCVGGVSSALVLALVEGSICDGELAKSEEGPSRRTIKLLSTHKPRPSPPSFLVIPQTAPCS